MTTIRNENHLDNAIFEKVIVKITILNRANAKIENLFLDIGNITVEKKISLRGKKEKKSNLFNNLYVLQRHYSLLYLHKL